MHHLHRPRGSAIDEDDPVLITPSSARWSYTGLRVVRLAPGAGRTLTTADNELVVLVLSGSCTVEVEGERVTLAGRQAVRLMSDQQPKRIKTRGMAKSREDRKCFAGVHSS